MINFRYHLISLVAVFLALGVGIVMGSTVIDRAIVDGLRNRIDTAEKNSIDRKVENERLRNSVENQNLQDTALAGHVVQSKLIENTVYVLTVGSVSDEVRIETQELIGISGARLGGVIDLDEEFLSSDKAKLARDLRALENVGTLIGAEKNNARQIGVVLMEMLNLQAGGTSDVALPLEQIQATFESGSVFKETERPQNYIPASPVSFIVLAQRSQLENMATVGFLTRFKSRFAVTVGLVGSDTDIPSRSESIELFGDRISQFSIVDNAESASGRATLILTHASNISGSSGVYGVSDKTSGYAPEINS